MNYLARVATLFFVASSYLYAQQSCLQYGVIPYANNKDIAKSYTNWKHYLETKIDRCIDIQFKATYSDVIKGFEKNDLDFAFMGPFSYVLATQVALVEPLVKSKTKDGKSVYRSFMVASPKIKKILGIKKPLVGKEGMKILKNKLSKHKQKWMVAFTDESSTSGYAVPSYYMKQSNIDNKNCFKKVVFAGTHESSLDVVKNSVIDISFSAEMFYKSMIQKDSKNKQKIALIWTSDNIPKSPIVINKNISNRFKKQLKDALVSMPKKFIPKLNKEIGYVSTNATEYKIIENIYEYIKK